MKQLMNIEILSIAIVNYFTSSEEIFKPTGSQLAQVRNLLQLVQQNYILAVDLMV